MEIRDLYDRNKNLTGKTLKKGERPTDGNYLLVVLVMIRNSKGEFLIHKRPESQKGFYGVTGGHCQAGETGLQGAIAETKEELGIDLKPEELTFLYGRRQDDKKMFLEVFFAQKDIDISSLKPQKEEVEFVEWMNIEKIKSLDNKSQFLSAHVDEIYRTIRILDIMNKNKKSSIEDEERLF